MLRVTKFFCVENLKILMTRFLGYQRCCTIVCSSHTAFSWAVELTEAAIMGMSLMDVWSYWRMLQTTSIAKYTVRFYTRATFFFKKEPKAIFQNKPYPIRRENKAKTLDVLFKKVSSFMCRWDFSSISYLYGWIRLF